MEQVVGGDVVEARLSLLLLGLRCRAILDQHAAHDEIHDHAPHLAQELRHGHLLARGVRFLDHGVFAEGFEGRSGGRPDEIGTADAGVPEVVELPGDVLAHFFENLVVPARARGGPLPADDPDGG